MLRRICDLPLLAALAPAERDRLAERAVIRSLRRGEALWLAGDPPARVYAVSKGVVKLVARGQDGDEAIVALAGPPRVIGAGAAIGGRPHELEAVALGPTTVAGFDADELLTAVLRSPGAAQELAATLADDARRAAALHAETLFHPSPQRLATRILELAHVIGVWRGGAVEFEVVVTQSDIARLTGIGRERACVHLRALRRSGILGYRGHRLRILRPDLLERVSRAAPGATPFPSVREAARARSRSSAGT